MAYNVRFIYVYAFCKTLKIIVETVLNKYYFARVLNTKIVLKTFKYISQKKANRKHYREYLYL